MVLDDLVHRINRLISNTWLFGAAQGSAEAERGVSAQRMLSTSPVLVIRGTVAMITGP